MEKRQGPMLSAKRKEALSAMELYFDQEYPFSEETYAEYERLERVAASATEELMRYCNITIRKA